MTSMKIQSVADLITNSSSEVFVIKCDDTWEEVEKAIKSWDIKDDGYSGMGGTLDVYDNKRPYNSVSKSKYPEEAWYPWIGDGYLGIHIDWGMKKHIDKIFKEFNVVGCEERDLVYNKKSGSFRLNTPEDDKNGLPEDETILLAGDGEILKMQKDYYSNLMKESEEAIVKNYGMDEAKKAYELYYNWKNAQLSLEEISINEKEYRDDTLSANDNLHKKYKSNQPKS